MRIEDTEQAGIGKEELIAKQILGIGLLIINAQTGQILTMREQMDDPRTARHKGELSIPLEKRKEGEDVWGNVCGAMAEIADDNISPYVRSCFFRTSDEFIHNGFSIDVDGRTIHCDIAVMIYDGPDIQFKPHNGETADVQWAYPSDLLAHDNTRLFARMALQEVLVRDIYRQNLSQYREFPQLRSLVFSEGLSIQTMYQDRERSRDMNLK